MSHNYNNLLNLVSELSFTKTNNDEGVDPQSPLGHGLALVRSLSTYSAVRVIYIAKY